MSDQWELKPFANALGVDALFCDGDWIESKDQDPSGDIRLVQLADILDGEFKQRSERFMTSAKSIELRTTLLKKGDLLIARMPDPIGRACIFPGSDQYCVTVVDIAIARPTQCDAKWLMYYLNSQSVRAEIEARATGSTRKRVSRSTLSEMIVNVPPLPEQKKIAEILSGIDRLICIKRVHIAKKEQLLASVLSERFHEIRNQSKSASLGDCCTHILDFRGRTPAKLGMDWGGGTIRALSANNVRNGYIDFDRECYMGGMLLYETWMTRGDCKQGDIIFTMEAPMGNVAIIPNNEKYILSQRVVLLSPERKRVLPEYMYWYMRSTYFRADCECLATGTTAKGIKQANLITIQIPLPLMEAQEKVACLAKSLDTSLKAEIGFLSQLIMLKQSLSFDLLSGRKRVTI